MSGPVSASELLSLFGDPAARREVPDGFVCVFVDARTRDLCEDPLSPSCPRPGSCGCCRPLSNAKISYFVADKAPSTDCAFLDSRGCSDRLWLVVAHHDVARYRLSEAEMARWLAMAGRAQPECFRCRERAPFAGVWNGRPVCEVCVKYLHGLGLPYGGLPACTSCGLQGLPQPATCLRCKVRKRA